MALVGRPDVALVDLREKTEREKHGVIPGSLHAPYPDLADQCAAGRHAARAGAAPPASASLFYCAFGERSAMAVQAAQDAGLATRLPHPGRHRRLEEGRRAAGALRLAVSRDRPPPPPRCRGTRGRRRTLPSRNSEHVHPVAGASSCRSS